MKRTAKERERMDRWTKERKVVCKRFVLAVLVAVCALPATALAPQRQAFAADNETSVTLSLPDVRQNLERGFEFYASLGGGPPHRMLVDTGSVGVLVPRTVLGPDAVNLVRRGQIEYTSDGKIFQGTYFRTPLVLNTGPAGTAHPQVQTVPIEVLAIDRQICDPQYPQCTVDRTLDTVGMLGVGFDRDTGSPAVNPFLQLVDIRAGRMVPGYIISEDRITLGITAQNTTGFRYVALRRNPKRPDDWAAAPGCYGFPAIPGFGYACGTILVDTGIRGMILRMPQHRRPVALSSSESKSALPLGTVISVAVPSPETALLSYQFTYEPSADPDPPIAPTSVRWSSLGETIFINTGRDVLAEYDYLYDAGSGRVGFRRR